jgi:hypothetical protein
MQLYCNTSRLWLTERPLGSYARREHLYPYESLALAGLFSYYKLHWILRPYAPQDDEIIDWIIHIRSG